MAFIYRAVSIIFLLAAAVFAGRVEVDTITSKTIGLPLRYSVILPDSYSVKAARGVRFPVLYLLHCAGCRDYTWISSWQVDKFIDSVGYIAAAPDDGDRLGWWLDSPVRSNYHYSQYLVEEFKPLIDSLYATLPGPGNAGLSGHSMGGFGSIHNLIKHPDVFGSAYGIKGGMDLMPFSDNWGLPTVLGNQQTHAANWHAVNIVENIHTLADKQTHIAFLNGIRDTWFNEGNVRLHAILDSLAIAHVYDPVEEDHFSTPFADLKRIMRYFDTVFTYQSTQSAVRRPGAQQVAPLLGRPAVAVPYFVNIRGQRLCEARTGRSTGIVLKVSSGRVVRRLVVR